MKNVFSRWNQSPIMLVIFLICWSMKIKALIEPSSTTRKESGSPPRLQSRPCLIKNSPWSSMTRSSWLNLWSWRLLAKKNLNEAQRSITRGLDSHRARGTSPSYWKGVTDHQARQFRRRSNSWIWTSRPFRFCLLPVCPRRWTVRGSAAPGILETITSPFQ